VIRYWSMSDDIGIWFLSIRSHRVRFFLMLYRFGLITPHNRLEVVELRL
jgi:hypothetical protein